MAASATTCPLVILGFDAGDPRLLQHLVSEGHLPTLASIMKQGCWGRITGPDLVSPQGCWLSLLSGISRSEHGYYYFRQLKPGTYSLEDVTACNAQALPFWSHLLGREKKVAILNVPDVHPLMGQDGVQIANWTVQGSSAPPSTEPAVLLADVHRLFGPPVAIRPNGKSVGDGNRQMYCALLERAKQMGALSSHLLSRDHFDLIVVVFSESHPAGHRFWQSRSGAQSAKTAADQSDQAHALRDVYQEIDRQMGLLLAHLPHEANVFILSDIGLEDQYPTIGLIEDFCLKLGYQTALEPDSPSLHPIAVVRRLVPDAWRAALSRYLPGTVRQRLRNDFHYGGTNWRKTTAFAIPSAYIGFIRVNLRAREPEGIVEPGAEYQTLLQQLKADLLQLIDPHTGMPAVKSVIVTSEAFRCGPPLVLPDIFVEWTPGAHLIPRLIHPRAELNRPLPGFSRPTRHSSHGFMAAAGSSIQARGDLGDVSGLDLAPTFLSLIGEPVPEELSGKIIEALTRQALARG